MTKSNMLNFVGLGLIVSFMWLTGEELYFFNLISIWILLLIVSYQKVKNHLVSLMLMLELLSVMSLFTASFYIKLTTSLNLMFILMSMMVGEATLGLAVLISLVRSNTNSLMMSGMN